GHRIPVYYCKKCVESGESGVIVSKTNPKICPKCGGTDIEQDPDVLDTWFSSWLWPFSTFGWPKSTPELKYFYPTDSLVTAQEIIFFWVARMVMAGLEFQKAVPFKNVYIHGTVRDITGTKMSKSLGNVIDPLDMIEKYGTDALRFSIISITSQGQDVFLAEGKFELGRNFANKIWNASRFILINMQQEDCREDLCVFFKAADLSLADKWILSRFYSTLELVTKCLDEFKFSEAANAIYEFLWHEFCDWYIEISKPNLKEKTTQLILYKILEKSLRMLHPVMPFVTEEIWQKLPREKDSAAESIMISKWPHLQKNMISVSVEEDMRKLIDIITAIRNIRAAWDIVPGREISVLVNTHDASDLKLLSDNSEMIKRLARIADLNVGKILKPKGAAASVVGTMEVYVPLEGLIDLEKERARLKKEEDRVALAIKSIESRLGDDNFTQRAPKDIVEKQRVQLAELTLQLEKLRANLKAV
ncbi:MAG: class I tRNA ligase family protein, partial [Candidatus Omnitrophota bacterium]